MATNPARQDAEHRLSNFIAYWVRAREDKAEAMAEHNKVIKDLEETIEALSAEIQGGTFQPTLPFDELKKPTITLSESDPDLQAAQQEAVGPTEDPAACVHCGHPEGVHGTTRKRGCMRAECDCKGYVHPNPLAVANVHAEPEKREAEL
jgi:hypothetical protein